MPNDFCELPDGKLLIADGFGPMLRWDGFSPEAEPAGVPKPATAPKITFAGRGNIVGTYTAYVRFLDADSLLSDLSPVSAQVAVSGAGPFAIEDATNALPIVVKKSLHGLTTGAVVKVTGAQGNTAANGVWTVVVVDPNHFALNTASGNGTYTGGGTYITGAAQVVYTGVAVPTSPRVVRRQILRNTDGQAQTYYVDIDTKDLSSTSFASSKPDTLLQTQEAQPILSAAAEDLANLYAVPPNDRPYVAFQLGRAFAAGVVEYTEGAVALSFGGTAVQGVATEWNSSVVGRYLFTVGGDKPYLINAVDVTNQVLTLDSPYQGNTDPYASYAVRPSVAEGRQLGYSEAGLPEAWPAKNSEEIPEDSDDMTGLMVKGSFLYVVERRHIRKFTYQSDPARDGFLFLAATRGCVNHRCFVLVEDTAYMLDEDGIHAFDAGRSNTTLSSPVQTLFRATGLKQRINWAASRYFHGVHDPATETIRWFVNLSGQYLPRHALCYAYQLERWWIEEYTQPIGSSCLGKLSRSAGLVTWGVGRDQVFLGTTANRVLAVGASPLDGIDPNNGPNAGSVVAASANSLTLDAAPVQGCVGCPLWITDGRGRGQWRTISAISGNRVTFLSPWVVRPDATSKWQIGGIGYSFTSGWYRLVEDEEDNTRRVEVMFEPAPGAVATLRRFRDRSDTPEPMRRNNSEDGVTTREGDGDVLLDLGRPSGFVQARFDGSRETYTHGPRLISVELEGVAAVAPTQIYQVTIDGAQDGRGQ